jgi:hypothetical protein
VTAVIAVLLAGADPRFSGTTHVVAVDFGAVAGRTGRSIAVSIVLSGDANEIFTGTYYARHLE